jgi:protein gp37
MATTEIEWADEVLNGLRGCRRKSPGCGGGMKGPDGKKGGCYAEAMAARIVRMGGYEWIDGAWRDDPEKKINSAARRNADKYKPLVRINENGEARWTGVFAFDPEKLEEALSWRKPRRVFVNSMSDLFGEGVSNEQIAAHFAVFAATPHITYLTLTKRAERMPEWFEWVEKRAEDGLRMFPDDPREWRIWQMLYHYARKLGVHVPPHHGGAWPLSNVHLGISAERQQEADERIPALLACPAAVRWVSYEPALGPVNLGPYMPAWFCDACGHFMRGRAGRVAVDEDEASPCCSKCRSLRVRHVGLDWIVAGSESGHHARPAQEDWYRAVRDDCQAAEVPFYLKQKLVGAKKVSLPMLDGRQWAEMPVVGGA